jgi:hypothetical protein
MKFSKLAWCLGLLFGASACFAQTITTFDMPNSSFTQPAAINAAGQIAGFYIDGLGQHGFLRQADGTPVSFDAPYPFPTGGPPVQTGATSINVAGQITGYVNHPTDVSFGFLRKTDGTFEVFGAGGLGESDCLGVTENTFTALTLPTGLVEFEGTVPAAINNRGQIAGACSDDTGLDTGTPVGFLRQRDGSIVRFAVPTTGVGNPWTRALAVNSRDQITGDYCCTPPRDYHAFLRERDGTITSFDATSLSGQSTTPTAMNSRGQITGYADHGFLREPDGHIVTFDVTNALSTQPAAINSIGEITGTYLDTGGRYHGFVRETDGRITRINVPNAIHTCPTGMNARGDITGWYQDAGGVHGFVRRCRYYRRHHRQ